MTGPSKPGPKPRSGTTASARLELRLTADELARWKQAADREVLSLSDFVRAAVEARLGNDHADVG